MQIYDVSVTLSDQTPTYPGDPGIEITQWLNLEQGDAANVSLLHFGAHSGTHVDAPAHFIKGGSKVDSLSFENLIGPACVLEVPDEVMEIGKDFLTGLDLMNVERVLFKTRNSAFWSEANGHFRSDYTYLTAEAAAFLVEKKIKLVGIDYLSVEKFKADKFETHEILLGHGVTILEGLDLRQVSSGDYELICLPLKIGAGSGDGAPARAVLRTLD